jgi:hypothetical protein
MANRIVLKRSSVANRVPLATDLVAGELAVNLTDKLLYTKDAAGNVITVGDGGGGGGSGTVTGVTGTAPVVSSGGAAPVISMAAANTSTPGYLTAADWNTFNGKQAALGFTPYNSSNPSGYITSSALSSYLPLSGGTLTGNLTIPRHIGVNSLVLNTYTTVNPSSNVFLYSQPNDRDSWIYLDSADTGSNWGIYHRQIDSAVSGLPGNSIGFVGGGNSALKAYISLADGSANFAGALTQGGNQVLHAGNYTSYSPSLTGSGASGTWGISISGNASTAYGLNVHTARNNEANKVVRTDANGYIQAGWINTDSGDNGTTAISRVYASHDGYVRYYTPANFRTVLDVPTRTGGSASGTWGISVTGTSSNITAYTINQSLGTGNGPTFDQVYVAGWFRNVGNQGLYNGTHGNHFYANDNAWWNVAGNNGSIVGIRLRTGGHDGATRGHLYADNGNNIGFLTQDGNWQIRCNNSEVELYDTSYANDFRTHIMYDRNDTAYYLDPNGTSELSTLTAATRTRWDMPRRTFNRQAYTGSSGYWTGTRGWGGTFNWNQAWGYGFGGFDIWGENTQHPQGNGYIHAQGICSGLHHVNDDGTSAYGFQLVGGTNASDRLWYRGAWGNTGNNWREIPMFDVNSGNGSWMWFAGWYDNNNSGYYVDPNGTSRMGTINADALNSYGNVIAYYSDERLKTIKGPILNAVEKLSQIDGFYYTGNDTAKSFGYDTEKLQLGVSAQRVESVFPELIERAPCSDKVNGAEYKTLDYSKLVPVLIEAIKEQQAQIEELRNLINSR